MSEDVSSQTNPDDVEGTRRTDERVEHGGLIAQSLLGGWRAAGARALLENAVLGGIDRGQSYEGSPDAEI